MGVRSRQLARPRRRRSAAAGFTLLEIVIAIGIFFMMVTLSMWTMTDSVDQSLASERARQLRMLAEMKLGEIAVFERHFDQNLGPEWFDDLPDPLRKDFEGWQWQLDVDDVTTFGEEKENAPALFASAHAKDASATGAGSADPSSNPASKTKGESQVLRQLVLKVWAPGEDGAEGDSIEIVTYLPQVEAKAASGTSTTGTPSGGGK